MPKSTALALALACALGQCLAFNLDFNYPLSFVSKNDDKSFGTSVLLQGSYAGKKPWIQISEPTPRAPTTGRKLPGKVYRCPIGEKCAKMNFPNYPGLGDRNTNEDFLGGAMASQSPEKPSTVLVCGSRWHDTLPRHGAYLFTGACIWMDPPASGRPQGSSHWLIPLLNFDRLLTQKHSTAVYDWAIGQAGISAHFPRRNSSAVLLGAPGVENWRGAVLYCEPDQYNSGGGARRRRQSGKPRKPVTSVLDKLREPKLTRSGLPGASLDGPKCAVPSLPSNVVAEFDYLGYQVTSGEFFRKGEMLAAAGAPRAGNGQNVLYGMVRVLRLPLYHDKDLQLVTSMVGVELGSYFGSSLAAGDFNGDGLDDLVVGAPLSTGEALAVDAGAVHLYLGKFASRGKELFDSVGRLLGKAPGGRFGQAMACPGDLDKDGYADLVVGAPHEDGGRGAIYVFNGGAGGLPAEYSQRISAQEVGSLHPGFGISLSPAVDIDGNKYLDLAVGLYGAVVLLRTYPVAELHTTLSSGIDRVPQNATSVTVTACVRYSGSDGPEDIHVIRTVEVSTKGDVAKLVDPITGLQVKALISNARARRTDSCTDLDIQIKNGSKYQDSITVQVSARINNKALDPKVSKPIDGEKPVGDNFCMDCAVERRLSPPTQMSLDFENECKDQTCIADLRLNYHFLRENNNTDTHVVGSTKQLDLVIGAENQGEPAYDTYLELTVPPLVALGSTPSNCEFNDATAKLRCNLRDLTNDRSSSSVRVRLDMSAVLAVGSGSLDFVVTGHTLSKQLVEDNRIIAKISLNREASLEIVGKPVDRASYRYASGNASTQQVDFAHEFTVDKMGESPIDDAVVRVRFPYAWVPRGEDEEVVFLQARQPEVLQDGQPLTCVESQPYLKETSESEDVVVDSDVEDSNSEEKREKRETSRDILAAGDAVRLPANETFFLHCDTVGVRCANIRCNALPFREDSSVRMTVGMRVNVAAIGDRLGGKSIVSLSTFGEVLWDSEVQIGHVNATTHFIGAAEKKEVANWIIALSIAGGLLLFVFVVMGLIKAGFFQRKQKMEMEALIEQEEEIKAINRQSQMPQDTGSDIEDS